MARSPKGDEAIQSGISVLDCFASLAMTVPYRLPFAAFRSAAARMSAFSALSLIFSPS
jgi:hypothetical protein